MDKVSKETLAESEIILNKTNIALARSRKLIESWVPAKAQDSQDSEDEEDFKPESETAGIGSSKNADDDLDALKGLKHKDLSSSDKLLEQILGKKAAQAHKKSREAASRSSGTQYIPSKQLLSKTEPQKRTNESEDEEEGRTSALKKRKTSKLDNGKDRTAVADQVQEIAVDHKQDTRSEGNVDGEGLSHASPVTQVQRTARPSAKKTSNYLDELLAQKAAKKKRKKGKTETGSNV